MRILKFWHRLHAELASLRIEHERRRQLRFKRWQRKSRVIMPRPRPESVANNWPLGGRPQ